MQDFIIVIDLDTPICRMLTRRLRAEGIYCRIMPGDATADALLQSGARGVILPDACTGTAASIPHMMDLLQMGMPLLCIGNAALTLCQTLGGTLTDIMEGGVQQITLLEGDPLFEGIEGSEVFLPEHRCMLLTGDQGVACAQYEGGILGFRATQRDVWGLASPMDRNDPNAMQMLLNFCRDVCGCTQWWTSRTFIEQARMSIQEAAGDGDALCALSGGVDSGVCALLGNLALGERLHCIFVDTGLLRKGEADEVMEFYSQQVGLNVKRIDASADFLAALDGVYAPADKERVIGRLLQDILYQEAESRPEVRLLIRGTNYSDVPTVPVLPEGMSFTEPVRELFKDEIRHVGEALGLPPAMIQRQPFPGSGLATRILSGVTAQGLSLLREADEIFRLSLEHAGLHRRLWQYYATLALSPIPNGGYLVILRAVQASEGGSGMPARLPSDLLERVTEEIMQTCPAVQRVMYDLSPSQSYKRLMAGS